MQSREKAGFAANAKERVDGLSLACRAGLKCIGILAMSAKALDSSQSNSGRKSPNNRKSFNPPKNNKNQNSVMKKPAKRLHVIPLGDLDDHEASTECWCNPLDTKDGIVTHNAKDCREQMERAGKPTGKIWCRIAEIYDAEPPHQYLIGGPEDPLQLLRRIGTPKAFMDLEGLRIICADFMAKWDARNS